MEYFSERLREAGALIDPLRAPLTRVANYLMTHLNEQVSGEVLSRLMPPELRVAK